jgi:hypothetical protein
MSTIPDVDIAREKEPKHTCSSQEIYSKMLHLRVHIYAYPLSLRIYNHVLDTGVFIFGWQCRYDQHKDYKDLQLYCRLKKCELYTLSLVQIFGQQYKSISLTICRYLLTSLI